MSRRCEAWTGCAYYARSRYVRNGESMWICGHCCRIRLLDGWALDVTTLRQLEVDDRFTINRIKGGAVHVVVRHDQARTVARPENSDPRKTSSEFALHPSVHVTVRA